MTTKMTDPDPIIDQMILLRIQLAQLESKIEALKPAFFTACAMQDGSQFHHEHAVIFRRLTPGKWDYPEHIIEHEKHLKQLKGQFQQTHEPSAGRELTWSIKLTVLP